MTTLTPAPEVIWECKIGGPVPGTMPDGWDFLMRHAVQAEFHLVAGVDAEFTFSGRGQLTEMERAVVEKRAPVPAASRAATPDEARAAFNAWYDAFEFRREYDKYGPVEAAFTVWQAAQAEARAKRIDDVAAKYAARNEYGEVIFPGQNWEMFVAALEAAQPASPAPLTDVMVDMVPPATSRDRWMYEQGRLAERDSRTPKAAALAFPQVAPTQAAELWALATRMVALHEEHGTVLTVDMAAIAEMVAKHGATRPEPTQGEQS